MAKQINSTWTPSGALSSPFPNSTSDEDCIDLHWAGLLSTIGAKGSLDSITSTWGGLPVPVTTTKAVGETAAGTLRRHRQAMLLAAVDHPIPAS
jgi:hypothetical protein